MPHRVGTQRRGRRCSPADQARAVALLLREEFGEPFGVWDASTGECLAGAADLPRPPGTAEKASADALGDGRYRLVLPVDEAGKVVLVAVGVIAGVARTPADAVREQARLQRWTQAVADRLRGAARSLRPGLGPDVSARRACDALLSLDDLFRRLRIHKEPARNQGRILQAASDLLRVEAVAWVPREADRLALVTAEDRVSPADCRHLVAVLEQTDWQQAGVVICNDVRAAPWGHAAPRIVNVLALPCVDEQPAGWALALNRTADGDPDGFRRADAAMLTTFVGLLGLHQRAAERYHDLKDLLLGLTRALTSAIDAKDVYTVGRSERVARFAVELGRELGLQEDELNDVCLAGLLHDVGMLGIRESVLCKPGPLTAEEYEHVKQHPILGYRILAGLKPLTHVLPGVLHHHERYDGLGYPEGLAGENIPLVARILAVADAFDAMGCARPYRSAMPDQHIVEVLSEGAGGQWDRKVIEAFLRCRDRLLGQRERGPEEASWHPVRFAFSPLP